MAKMGKMDSIRVTISLERNNNLIHRRRVVIEVQNLGLIKVSRTTSWHATLQQAVDHAAHQLAHMELYRVTGIIPTLSDKCK